MVSLINKILPLICILFLLSSCIFDNKGKDQKNEVRNFSLNNKTISILTDEQELAFEALNVLQMNGDEKDRLYSTFANLDQFDFPPDTNFVITQLELLIAMKAFAKEHYKNLDVEMCDSLINNSVLAQKEYTVLHYIGNSTNVNYKNGIPLSGHWVIPNVLGRRDINLKW